MRILHFPSAIGNQPSPLSKAERRLGHSSAVVSTTPPPMGYQVDKILPKIGSSALGTVIDRAQFALRAPFRYDVLHAYFGRSLLSFEDMPSFGGHAFSEVRIAKRLGRATIMTLQGCDIRIASEINRLYQWRACRSDGCRLYSDCVGRRDAERRAFANNQLTFFDRVFVLNPDIARFAPGAEFLPYAIESSDAPYRPARPDRKRPIIAHGPTDRSIKGTAAILSTLESLRPRHDFELRLIEGLDHQGALAMLGDADLVIDQINVGWYGAFAVEAMAMGKPTLCFLRNEDRLLIPATMNAELPIVDLRPDRLAEDIEDLLNQRWAWPAIGARSALFARRWHSADAIAAALCDVYRDVSRPLEIERYLPATGAIRLDA